MPRRAASFGLTSCAFSPVVDNFAIVQMAMPGTARAKSITNEAHSDTATYVTDISHVTVHPVTRRMRDAARLARGVRVAAPFFAQKKGTRCEAGS